MKPLTLRARLNRVFQAAAAVAEFRGTGMFRPDADLVSLESALEALDEAVADVKKHHPFYADVAFRPEAS